MKKYITLAALLAAGTTFANAEYTLEDAKGYAWLDGETLKWAAGVSTSEDESGNLVVSLDDGSWVGSSGNYTTATFALTIDLDKLSDLSESTRVITTNTNSAWGLGYTAEDKFSGVWQNSNPYSTYVTSAYSSGIVNVVITVNNSGTRIYVGDENTFWSNTSLKGSFAAGKTNELTISGNVLSSIKGVVAWDSGFYSDTASAGSAFTALASVPEPSAFGMLAGLGALALVASRRRRK